MDPITISRIGRIRQQEILEWAEHDRGVKPLREYVLELGNLLIRVGQRMVNAAGSALETKVVAPQTAAEHCAENC